MEVAGNAHPAKFQLAVVVEVNMTEEYCANSFGGKICKFTGRSCVGFVFPQGGHYQESSAQRCPLYSDVEFGWDFGRHARNERDRIETSRLAGLAEK